MAKLQRIDQRIDLRTRVIYSEAGPTGGRDPQVFHKRLGTMMPGPNRHALLVEYRRYVVRMRLTGQGEAENRGLGR